MVCRAELVVYLLFPLNNMYYIIDQERGHDAWILAEFCFWVFMDRDEDEVHKNAKRERGQYPTTLTELPWSIKDLFYGFKSTEKNDFRAGRTGNQLDAKVVVRAPIS